MPPETFPSIVRWIDGLMRIPAWAEPWPAERATTQVSLHAPSRVGRSAPACDGIATAARVPAPLGAIAESIVPIARLSPGGSPVAIAPAVDSSRPLPRGKFHIPRQSVVSPARTARGRCGTPAGAQCVEIKRGAIVCKPFRPAGSVAPITFPSSLLSGRMRSTSSTGIQSSRICHMRKRRASVERAPLRI